jgi:alpha-L-fucosidase 2
MWIKNFFILITILSTIFSCSRYQEVEKDLDPSLALWYDEPADEWTEALPIGNGGIGAMVFGQVPNEIIQFNEETLWTGQPHDYSNEGAGRYLDELRRLLWEGKQDEAHVLGNRSFMSKPLRQFNYQPFGNILLGFTGHENPADYRRILDLEEAVVSVEYEIGRINYKREIFTTHPGKVMVIRLEASKNKGLNFSAGMDSPHAVWDVSVENNEIIMKGKADDYHHTAGRGETPYPESMLNFEARLLVEAEGGGIIQKDNRIEVVNARNATLYLAAATNFVNYKDISGSPSHRCIESLKNVRGKSYKTLKDEHINDYGNLFNRVSLDLGTSEISKRPTDERLISFTDDEDPNLTALLFQYGRYLLISSSRPGNQPANLQGIWNEKLDPPWGSKYTININTEMNYWPAEITNLPECAEPLISMVEDLSVTGRNIALNHYHLNGWVTHHNTDLWRGAAPINDANHGIWPTGGAWLSQHLWWHYQFSGDKDFLKERAYPVLKEASRFFTGYLVEYPKNKEWLVSGPSNSPELGGLVMGPTMDHQIIRNLFSNTIEAAEILGIDSAFAKMLKEKRALIAPNQIGRHGQLQEWLEDIDNPEEKHRHVSHLWGLHPGEEIHPLITPELAEACKVTLSHRGDGGTGWSRAWKINFWARLLDGDHAFLLLKNLIVPSITNETDMRDKGGLYYNLFDAHPPFQIDGNFGVTSGITEMLLQSHLRDNHGDYFQDLLPALPAKFQSGKISGIRGRGGFEIEILWENGELVSTKIKSFEGNKLNLRYKNSIISTPTNPGDIYTFVKNNFK